MRLASSSIETHVWNRQALPSFDVSLQDRIRYRPNTVKAGSIRRRAQSKHLLLLLLLLSLFRTNGEILSAVADDGPDKTARWPNEIINKELFSFSAVRIFLRRKNVKKQFWFNVAPRSRSDSVTTSGLPSRTATLSVVRRAVRSRVQVQSAIVKRLIC